MGHGTSQNSDLSMARGKQVELTEEGRDGLEPHTGPEAEQSLVPDARRHVQRQVAADA